MNKLVGKIKANKTTESKLNLFVFMISTNLFVIYILFSH